MLTPQKIKELIKDVNSKHTQPRYGSYPPVKKIVNYILRRVKQINNDSDLHELDKVKEMTNLLEGFIRYLNDTNRLLRLDIEKILTYIYYPDSEEVTLNNKDNLLIGNKGETVRLWHDAYFMNNRKLIINRLIDCKNVLYNKTVSFEYMQNEGNGMPEQMYQKYKEMLELPEHAIDKKTAQPKL